MIQENVIGPFLCRPTSTSMGLWISILGTPKKVEVAYSASVVLTGDKISFQALPGSQYGIWTATIPNLLPHTSYFYRVWIDDVEQLFGCETTDFKFKTLIPEDGPETPAFVFMSCHGIEAYEKAHPTEKPRAWEMWDRLLKVLDEEQEISFAILGGDQVYMDTEFEEDHKFKKDEKDQEAIRRRILGVYQRYWSHPLYRKVFFRIPSFLMWDDHDLIDGFGSRVEQFNRKKLEVDEWGRYRKYLTSAFYEFQACRNPGLVSEKGPYSFVFKLGPTGFVAMDLRSQRNSAVGAMMDQEHREFLNQRVQDLIAAKVKSIIFISPVTLTRMGGSVEQALGQLASALGELSSLVTQRRTNHALKPLFWGMLSMLFLMSAQMIFRNQAGHLSTILGFFICLILAFYDIFGISKNILGKQLVLWRAINWITIGVILGVFLWRWDWWFLKQDIAVEFKASVLSTLSLMWPTLVAQLLALICFSWGGVKSRNRKDRKWSTRLGLIFTLFFLINVFWTGLPERKDILIKFLLVPNLVMQVLGLVSFALAALEALGIINEISGLDDDVKDSWSSETNADELAWFRSVIRSVQEAGVKVSVLAGDIHTGGISRLSFDSTFQNPAQIITQVVSSPMSYVPMAGMVEKLTSGAAISSLIKSEESLYAYNLFYRCQRNFIVVRPMADSKLRVSFYFEDIKTPEIFII